MKAIIQRIRTAAILAVLFAIGLASTARATAPTATVVWESDFGTATKTGTDGNSYTITLNGNSVNSDGNLVINNSDNSYLGASIALSETKTAATILIKYSSLAAYSTANATLANIASASYGLGARSNGAGTLNLIGFYNESSDTFTFSSTPTLPTGSGYFILGYSYNTGTMAYAGSELGSSMSGGNTTSLRWSSFPINRLSIGGGLATGKAYPWNGVVIEKVAIFFDAYNATQLAEYVFPGDEALKSAVSEALDAGLEVAAWRENSATTFHTSKTGTVNSDGSVSPSAVLTYGNYGRTSAIGPVLVYDKAGYVASSDAQFYPFAVGGLYVNALGTNDAAYEITGTGTRYTYLGYTDYDTYFTFNQPFAFNREGNVTIYGTATVTTASGVTFNCNSSQTSNTTILNSGATLKLAGEGNMSVTTLNASNGTLDFSALSSRTAALPYITGTVQLGANTDIVLPAGTTSPYTIGTAVTGTFPSEITIGSKTHKATVTAGENAGEIAWTINSYDINSEGTLTLEDMFTSTSTTGGYEINVNESATLNIASATTIASLTINVASGKTLTLTGNTLTASKIAFTGAGVATTQNMSMFSGTLTGDGTLCYDMNNSTTKPSGIVCTSDDWAGMLWIKNGAYTGWNFNTASGDYIKYGSANSTLRLENVSCYLNATETVGFTLDLHGEGLKITNGNAQKVETVKKLTGSGTLAISGGSANGNGFIIQDGSEFAGSINITTGNYVVNFADSGTYASSTTGGKIIVGSGETATVASGKTWSTNNKNGIEINGTLTLADSTSTLTGTISGTGTIVANQQFPVPGSLFTGTLTINGDAQNGTTTDATAIYGSTLNVASGQVGVTGNVTKLPDTINIASGAFFVVMNASLESLSLGVGTWDGTLAFIDCTSLASLTIDAGTKRAFPTTGNTGLTLPNTATLSAVNIVLDEVKGEGGTITLTNVSGIPAVEGRTYNFTVNRVDGTTVTGTYDSAASTVSYTPAISGAATDIDWDFTDGEDDALEQAPSGVSKNADSTMTFYTDATDSTKTGVYIKHHPYITGAASFMGNNSAAMTVAVVGTMPATSNTIFLNVGSAYSQQYGLVFVTTTNANEVLIGYNYGGTVTPITTMTVPNSSTARHSYIVTKEDGDSTTTFTVYLDGIKWKTVTTESKITFPSSYSGVQVGSDFGSQIRNAGTYIGADDDVGVLNVLRVYGRIITPAEIAVYADTFPYVSPNGASSRTFATAAEEWVEATDTDWTNTDSSGDVTSGTAPTAGASVTVTATAETEITVNLDSDTQYEALTINGSATTLAANSGSGKISVTGMTVVGAPVTVEYGAADFTGGPMTITEDGSITFDYSAYDISAIYTTTDIPLTSDVDEDADKVFLTTPSASYRTVSLVYTSGHYAMRVTPNHQNGAEVYFKSGYLASNMNGTGCGTVYVDSAFTTQTVMFPGDIMVINDNSTLDSNTKVWIKDDFVGNIRISRTSAMSLINGGDASGAILDGVTITVDSGSTLNISKNDTAALNIGAAIVNGEGTVNMPSATTVSGAVSGTAALTISGTVNVASGGSIANAVAGTGTITYAAIPAATPSSYTDWTGTVVLPSFDASTSGVNFNNYGISGSVVEVTGMTAGWITSAGATVAPTLKLSGDMVVNAMSSWTYTFAKIIGSGNLSFSTSENTPTITITSVDADSTSDDYYSGTISNTTSNKVTIGTLTLASGTSTALGTKLYTTGGGVKATSVVIGEETFTNTLGKNDGIYLPAAISVSNVTFDYYATYTNANVTATVADADATYKISVNGGTPIAGTVDGTTVTFENVGGYEFGDSLSYTITASGTSEGTTESASETVAKTAVSGDWMAWSDGGSNVGSWTTNGVANVSELPYSDSVVAFSGTNTYTAAWTSTGEVVTVTTNVKFGDVADPDITPDTDAQAAVRIGAGNVFQVYAGSTPDWVNVYNDELGSPDGDDQYGVTVKLNYSTQTYGVDITKVATTYPLTNATHGATFPLAKAASAMQQVSYLGAGSFISLSGEYVSAGYTADVGTDGSATNVVVSSEFVSDYMSGVLAKDIAKALNPNATDPSTNPEAFAPNGNGLSYFASYALGLDPTDEDDKPTIKVETNSEGKFVVTLTDKEGNVLDIADNVAVTLSVKTGATPESVTGDGVAGEIVDGEGSAEGKSFVIDPSKVDSVKYYKVRIDIGAK